MGEKPQGRRADGRRGGAGGGSGGQRHRRAPNKHVDGPSSSNRAFHPSSQEPQSVGDSGPPLTEPASKRWRLVFADLAGQNLVHPTILSTITDDLKFDHMMPVQAATLWELLPPNRSDCLVQAKTGTGKTVAFLLPALQTIVSQKRGRDAGISLLVVSPTRELAMQIAQEATNLLRRMPGYRVRIAIGGTNKDKEEKQILGGCDILIATPGRLIDHLSNEDVVYAFRQLDTLVLDEADRLLDMGFMPALRDIVRHLPDRNRVKRQGMLFSATIAPHVNQVAGIVLEPGFKFISTIPAGEVNTHERVPQFLVTVPTFSSLAAAMVGSIRHEAAQHRDFKAIVFAPTAAQAGFYGHILSMMPGLPPVSTLHSRISQNKRTNVTNDFRKAKAAILVATDVVARGMDFPGVTTVFQVGIPTDEQSYIHRLGRTARADAEGRGIFIVADAEAWFPKWTLKKIALIPQDADLSSAAEVYRVVEAMDGDVQANIYKAWLGYYKNHLKAFKWDCEELVRQANTFARDGLGTPDTPPIAKGAVGKMGLRGTRGLNTVPDRPRLPQSGGGRPRRGDM
ncbi:ATP-dependent RNA helicase [Ophiocordyceps sinensis CO18]|uniref:ATP-dependent RNA helicase n=1 Tax=Ophiocordyceps sinensis (strain Co18 / CGMCC 3.14243) TaxID=911162 RepID=T5AP33_OPHSC|nr:ATP-dependent RNA helicase [Ophiocordyceps sinensis CO18]